MIAALFVAKGGCYFGLPGVDPWDEARDARLYAGPHPVVAHPPCSSWSRLAPINQKRYGIPIGADGGCFESALASVISWGGVLEHPAGSRAFARFGLPAPVKGQWSFDRHYPGAYAGWVGEVCQATYGHRAKKMTWLYFVGRRRPAALDWSVTRPTATVSYLKNHGDSGLPRLPKKEALATPPAFRTVLLGLAEGAR